MGDTYAYGDDGGATHGDDRRRSGPPPWLLPAGVGAVVALLIAGLLVVMTRDGGTQPPPTSEAPVAATAVVETTDAPVDERVEPATTESATTEPATTETETASACEEYEINESLPVGLCDRGDYVAYLQAGLDAAGYSLDADGLFGPGTEAAVREFQIDNGLVPSGILDEETVALLPIMPIEGEGGGEVDAGITIDSEPWNIQYSCRHYPFQDRETGFLDAHATMVQHLVANPSNTQRSVIELWLVDDLSYVVVNDLDGRTLGRAELPSIYDGVEVSVPMDDGSTRFVTVGGAEAYADRECDVLFIDGQSASSAYGVIDVCTPSYGGTLLTLNTRETEFGTTPNTLYLQQQDGGIVGMFSGSLLGGGYFGWVVTNGQWEMTARSEVYSGGLAFPDEPDVDDATFMVSISQYPEGGHDCLEGQ